MPYPAILHFLANHHGYYCVDCLAARLAGSLRSRAPIESARVAWKRRPCSLYDLALIRVPCGPPDSERDAAASKPEWNDERAAWPSEAFESEPKPCTSAKTFGRPPS